MRIANIIFGNRFKLFALGGAVLLFLSVGFFGYRYITNLQNAVISQTQEIAQQRIALESSLDTIRQLQDDMERGAELRRELSDRLDQANENVADLRSILARHDLTYLAEQRPGLIETRINDGTQQVFDELERITSN